jgi:hypothetical protein
LNTNVLKISEITNCEMKVYKSKSRDFCLNGKSFKALIGCRYQNNVYDYYQLNEKNSFKILKTVETIVEFFLDLNLI